MKTLRAAIIGIGAFIALLWSSSLHAQIVINEVCSSNTYSLYDEDGSASDWIELYNTSGEAVSLQGWGLSDKSNAQPKWVFQQGSIAPYGYFIVFASDKNRQSTTRPHTNFKISQGEEVVYLYNPQGVIVSMSDPRFIPSNHTLGRIPDGSGLLYHLKNPTPGSSNNSAHIVVDQPTAELVFSHTAGVYTAAFSLSISCNQPNAEIRYTLDGSEPTRNSPVYTGTIYVHNTATESPVLASIPTSDTWKHPKGSVNGAFVVRAQAFDGPVPISHIHTHTFFVEEDFTNRYGFPILSITAEKEDFFSDEKGIYVRGPGQWPNWSHHGDQWERPIHLEYFVNGTRVLQQNIGARIHGRSSRAYPQKSIRLVADKDYGSAQINYPFFGEDGASSFKRLIVRTPDRMFNQSYFVDPLTYEIARNMDIDGQDYQPVIVFINGEYWGIHQLRERLDKHYLATHYNVNPDNVDILDFDRQLTIVEGNMNAWNELQAYLLSHDLSNSENYAEVASKVDIDNLLDYLIVQLFFANNDFPINNQKLWRERKEGAKWRFFYFDGDDSMNQRHYNPLAYYLSGRNYGDPLSILFSSLLKNEGFRQQFGARFVYHISTTFEPSRVVEMVRKFEKDFLPMVPENIMRWNHPDNFHEWQRAVQDIQYFAVQRCAELTQQLQSLMADPFTVFPNPASQFVTVRLNDLDFKNADSFYLSVELHDLHGRIVVPEIISAEGGMVTIDVQDYPVGIYLLKIKTGKVYYTKRLIVQ
ncbi:MAG TPA: CotH kinase family protein [Flavobacteriales bacterium]